MTDPREEIKRLADEYANACQSASFFTPEARAALHAAIDAIPLQPVVDFDKWRDPELAASPTPKAQAGTWTLTAPDGRTWQADTPLRCAAAEQRERVPPDVALARIVRGLDEPESEANSQ